MINIHDIAQLFKDVRILGVGESTHGAHEFFEFKRDLFIELVVHHGFTTFMLEDRQAAISVINDWIRTGKGSLDHLMNKLYPVWNVDEIKHIILWLRDNSAQYPVELVGFDIMQTEGNIRDREHLMAQNIFDYISDQPTRKALVSAHNYHLKYTSVYDGDLPMGSYLKNLHGDQYQSIAQFFGAGTLSAAYIVQGKSESSDRTLRSVLVENVLLGSVEERLDQLSNGTLTYINRETFEKSATWNTSHTARSIGWGIVKGNIDEEVEEYQLNKEFSGVLYVPTITPTNPR